jgi:hypothetical protein
VCFFAVYSQFHWRSFFCDSCRRANGDFKWSFFFKYEKSFFILLLLVVGLEGKAIESNKVHRIKNHTAKGGRENLLLFLAAKQIEQNGRWKKQLAPRESFVTLENTHGDDTNTPWPLFLLVKLNLRV